MTKYDYRVVLTFSITAYDLISALESVKVAISDIRAKFGISDVGDVNVSQIGTIEE